MLLFAISLFFSSTLMFLIEPMFAKMILPMFGGTPSVWNMCIVFYQITLLAGYVYAYLITKWLKFKHQAISHAGLVLLVFMVLPIAIPNGLTQHIGAYPVLWLFILLLISIGLPFFAISTTAPVLQKWFTMTGHPLAKDPYFLYSASNLGSMVALFGYLFVLEPFLPLPVQSKVWSGGYALLTLLILGCVMMVWRSSQTANEGLDFRANHATQTEPQAAENRELTVSRRIRWVLLAFVPSSLLLGVTNYISTDIAQIPLIWIIPLALYLVTFIFVFAQKTIFSQRILAWVQPFFLIPLMIPYYWGFQTNSFLGLPLHLLLFFVTSMICHGELANSRPSTNHLTEFYVWLSVGGVMGGLFNTLVAPLLFNSLAEYPLVIALACTLRPVIISDQHKSYERWLDLYLPLAFGILLAVSKPKIAQTFMSGDSIPFGVVVAVITFASCFIGTVLYSFRNRPLRLGLAMGAVILSSLFLLTGQGQILYSERNFFGILKVLRSPSGDYHFLYHGTTLHGAQSLDPARSHEPLTYFHRTGPLGQVFEVFSNKSAKTQIAIVGLGTGTIASYGSPGQHFTFFEIDPAVERIARDKRYFTFLKDCSSTIEVVIGDARLSLARVTDPRYNLMVLDAFSSDAIPIHLLTKEALQLYLSRLADGGILAFHISNRYLDLRPVLGSLAHNSHLTCLVREDTKLEGAEEKTQKSPSVWVVMSRQPSDLGALTSDGRWKPLHGRKASKLWTDDFSNIPSVFIWSSVTTQIEQMKKLFHGNPSQAL